MTALEGLSVRELLKCTYDKLAERNQHQELVLPEVVLAEIADDSDWHRTRKGYMVYERANLFRFNGKKWAVARGERGGGYPAEPYDSDIMALELLVGEKPSEQVQEELKEEIRGSRYFENTLICGTSDGQLFVNKHSRFREKMAELLRPEISGFVAQRPEYDTDYISLSTLQYPTTKNMLWKPELVNFLTETIETVIKSD